MSKKQVLDGGDPGSGLVARVRRYLRRRRSRTSAPLILEGDAERD
jgi:hypothetical protein